MNYLQPLTEERREIIRKKVNCKKDSIEKDVQHLIEWMEKQPHLPHLKDEDILANYLLNCGNSLEKTKTRIEMFFKFKATIPEIFCNQNPFDSRMEIAAEIGIFLPLPKPTPDGCRVIVCHLSNETPMSIVISNFDNVLKMCQMSFDTLSKYDYSRGLIIICDVKNTSTEFVAFATSQLYRLSLYLQNVKLLRYEKIYLYNMNRATELLMTVTKHVLAKKFFSRIEILKNISDVMKILPKEIIPRDFGGDELSLEELKSEGLSNARVMITKAKFMKNLLSTEMWYQELQNQHELLKMSGDWIADLSKVPTDSQTSELFGPNGSFRRIAID